jgi:hypothetical protein
MDPALRGVERSIDRRVSVLIRDAAHVVAHDDVVTGNADIDTNSVGAPLVLMLVERLEGHATTGDAVVESVELARLFVNVLGERVGVCKATTSRTPVSQLAALTSDGEGGCKRIARFTPSAFIVATTASTHDRVLHAL